MCSLSRRGGRIFKICFRRGGDGRWGGEEERTKDRGEERKGKGEVVIESERLQDIFCWKEVKNSLVECVIEKGWKKEQPFFSSVPPSSTGPWSSLCSWWVRTVSDVFRRITGVTVSNGWVTEYDIRWWMCDGLITFVWWMGDGWAKGDDWWVTDRWQGKMDGDGWVTGDDGWWWMADEGWRMVLDGDNWWWWVGDRGWRRMPKWYDMF